MLRDQQSKAPVGAQHDDLRIGVIEIDGHTNRRANGFDALAALVHYSFRQQGKLSRRERSRRSIGSHAKQSAPFSHVPARTAIRETAP
jgi:hypothetical protein